tara:strand:+ start:1876 stop:2343 length:468 start_codon:yes stop_codon:yes gene_type:complete
MSDEEKKAEDAAKKKAPAKKAAAAKDEKPAKADAKKADKKPAAKKEKKADVKKSGKLIDDTRLYDVIVRPIVTEKSTLAAEQGKVVFKISPTATKTQVKSAVEQLFGVKVTKVNTVLTKGKAKRFRGRQGQRSDQRKAIVTLAEGQTIDIAAGVK